MEKEEFEDPLHRAYIDRAVEDATNDIYLRIKNDLLQGDMLRIQPLKDEIRKASIIVLRTRAHFLSERFTQTLRIELEPSGEELAQEKSEEIENLTYRNLELIKFVNMKMGWLLGRLSSLEDDPFKAYADWIEQIREELSRYTDIEVNRYFPDEHYLAE